MFVVKVYKYLPHFCIPLVYLCCRRSYPYKNMVRYLTASVGLSIPLVAPADVPAITAQDDGIFTSGGD